MPIIVQATLFESLVRCSHLDSQLRSDLLAAGYDLERPRATYPANVFLACQDLVLRQSYGGMSASAQRQLGRDLVQRYFDTLVGRVVAMALKMAGPERAMKRVALSFSSVFDPVDIRTEQLGPEDWRVFFRNYPFSPEAAAGTCEGALRHAGAAKPRVEVERQEVEGFDLRIRW